MRFRHLPLTCLVAFLVLSSARAIAADPEPVAADTELLRTAGLDTDGPALIDYFKKRVVDDTNRERIAKLIKDFASEEFDTRENASLELLKIGAAARAQLKEATTNPDVEVSRRSNLCLLQIDKVASSQFMSAAVRLLAHHKPDGATEILLAFLPSSEYPEVTDEIVRTLAVVGFKSGEPNPALIKALTDKHSLRRSAAADALWRGGDEDERKGVRKLLDDADVNVRVRVALAMFDTKEKEAVPALINLLTEAPRESAWRVEDALYRIAGENAPEGSLSGDDAARKKYRDQWAAWWMENSKKIDLAKIDAAQQQLGFTLVTQMDLTGTTGRVVELDQKGKPRWQLENLKYPIDAQLLPGGDKVLVAEYSTRVVTERNMKNEILWTKQVNSFLLGARRLKNGNTFIVTRNQLLEVNKEGKEVMTINRTNNDVVAAVKLRNGQIAMVTNTGVFIRMDDKGKELKSFNVGTMSSIGSHFEVLPNGRILVPQYSVGRVAEFDADGKQIWSANITQPTGVTRLANGNTLVCSRYGRYIVELDREGKEVSRTTPEGRPMKIERR